MFIILTKSLGQPSHHPCPPEVSDAPGEKFHKGKTDSQFSWSKINSLSVSGFSGAKYLTDRCSTVNPPQEYLWLNEWMSKSPLGTQEAREGWGATWDVGIQLDYYEVSPMAELAFSPVDEKL